MLHSGCDVVCSGFCYGFVNTFLSGSSPLGSDAFDDRLIVCVVRRLWEPGLEQFGLIALCNRFPANAPKFQEVSNSCVVRLVFEVPMFGLAQLGVRECDIFGALVCDVDVLVCCFEQLVAIRVDLLYKFPKHILEGLGFGFAVLMLLSLHLSPQENKPKPMIITPTSSLKMYTAKIAHIVCKSLHLEVEVECLDLCVACGPLPTPCKVVRILWLRLDTSASPFWW